MGGLNKLPDIDAYFANTSLEHLQKVYKDVKDFENTNLCVRDFLNSENQDVFAEKHFDSESNILLSPYTDEYHVDREMVKGEMKNVLSY